MKTQVISLWGSPGAGKSTAAAKVFAQLKELGYNAELVREYVKDRVWQGVPIGQFDQWLFLGIQASRETVLFGKVSHIVTDSPFLMGAMYVEKYMASRIITQAALDLLYYIAEKAPDVSYRHILLKRAKPYNPLGRYETEEQARDFDVRAEDMLAGLGLKYEKLTEQQLLESII